MKKTLNINLGGMAFIIDENAFEALFNYLEALKRKFKNEAERDEILHDIEARMAELLTAALAGRKEVVSLADIQQVINALGKPEDIAGDEDETNPTAETTTPTQPTFTGGTQQPNKAPVKKRLYRDNDDAKVGGVIAGMCHYFGIDDPAWMRIAALVLIPVTSGAIILLYLLLLIAVPEATTAAEKLQMKGEPVNINTIEKEIKDAATRTGESVNRLVSDNSFWSKLWGFTMVVTIGVAKFISGIVIFFAVCALIVLLLSMFGITLIGNQVLQLAPNLLVDNPGVILTFKIGAALFIATPLIGIIYAGIRAWVGKNKGRAPWFKWVLLLAWWAGVFLLSYSAWECGMAFRSTGTIHQYTALTQPANANLTVVLTDSLGNTLPVTKDDDESTDFHISFNGIFIYGQDINDEGNIVVDEPSLQIMPSANDSFYVETILNSQGRNRTDAVKNTRYIIYGFTQADSIIKLPGYALLDKNGKYRHQNVKVRIHIPEGKKINFGRNIDRWAAVVTGDNTYNDTYFANTTWTVENGKVKCIRGENHFNATQNSDSDKDSDKDDNKGDY